MKLLYEEYNLSQGDCVSLFRSPRARLLGDLEERGAHDSCSAVVAAIAEHYRVWVPHYAKMGIFADQVGHIDAFGVSDWPSHTCPKCSVVPLSTFEKFAQNLDERSSLPKCSQRTHHRGRCDLPPRKVETPQLHLRPSPLRAESAFPVALRPRHQNSSAAFTSAVPPKPPHSRLGRFHKDTCLETASSR